MNTSQRPTVAYETHDAVLPSGNTRYHRSGAGRGPVLLFLHGSGPGVTALSNWKGALERLGDRFDCVAPDVLGFGLSAHPDPAPHGMTAFTKARVEALFELLDHLGLDRVSVVGNSMGGMLAMEMALAHGDRIDRLTLMGTGGVPFEPTPGLFKLMSFYDDPTAESLGSLMREFLFDPTAFGDVDALARDRFELANRPEVRRSHLAMLATGKVHQVDLEALRSLPHQVQLVHGREDRIVPVETSLRLFDTVPHSRLHALGECGHWLQLERPREFDQLIVGFHTPEEDK
ncbi:alpha/beta fold hydrolase [Streptomyces sp. YKOK-I1]